MKRKLKYTKWIDSYLEGGMSEESRRKFEAELEVNVQLREEYWLANVLDEHFLLEGLRQEMQETPDKDEAEKLAMEAMQEFIDSPQSSRLGPNNIGSSEDEAVGSQPPSKPLSADDSSKNESSPLNRHSRRRRRIIYWSSGIAASIALIIAIFAITNRPPSPDKLFKQYYAELSSEEFVDEDMPQDVYSGILKGIEQYEANDYDNAIITFGELEPWKETYPQISLFKGLVLLDVGKYTEAIEDFEACAKIDSKWQKYARWFQGICYLRLGNPKLAFFYIIEKTGASENLSPGSQKLVRSVNLLVSGRWKEYRKHATGNTGPLIIGTDDIIAGSVIFVFIVCTIIAIVDVIRRKSFKLKHKIVIIMIFFYTPGFSAIAYLILKRMKKLDGLVKDP